MTKKQKYFLTQKIVGALTILFYVALPILLDIDATLSVIMVPIGISMLFSKEKILTTTYFFEDDEESN